MAAALNQFTLIDRVILFMMPLWLILLGYGFDFLWRIKLFPLKLALICIGVFMIWNFNMFWLFERKLGFQEITEGMDYLMGKRVRGDQVYIHESSGPTYIYYTELHPDAERYNKLKGGHQLAWDDDYATVTQNVTDTAYFLYTSGFPDEERIKRTSQIEKNMKQVDYFRKNDWYVFVYTYVPKSSVDTTDLSN
jgi:hypothetical protein